MKILVERRHIDNAVRKDSHCCMIADAIKEQVPGSRYIVVDIQTIRFSDLKTKERYIYLTPHEAQWGIIRFDRGAKNIQPFEFHLRTPATIRKTNRRKGSKKNGKKRLAKSTRPHVVVVRKEREFGIRQYDTKTVKGYPRLKP
jgi:hypothetical protein